MLRITVQKGLFSKALHLRNIWALPNEKRLHGSKPLSRFIVVHRSSATRDGPRPAHPFCQNDRTGLITQRETVIKDRASNSESRST